MKLWKLQVPRNSGYAELLSIYVRPQEVSCATCGLGVAPSLLLEWRDGSDTVGDFVTAGARVVVKESIADELIGRFRGAEKVPVQFVDHPNLYRPKRITNRTPRRIWLPYVGPELCELRACKEVPLLDHSTVTERRRCEACGAVHYRSFEGIEKRNSREHLPRQPGKGLFISRREAAGFHFLRPKWTGLFLCTSAVRHFVSERGYSNIEFLDVGNTADSGVST